MRASSFCYIALAVAILSFPVEGQTSKRLGRFMLQENSDQTTTILYDGTTVPFASSKTLDANGSTLVEEDGNAVLSKKHLKARLVVKNGYGGVSYLLDKGAPVDFSKGRTLTINLKVSKKVPLTISVIDINNVKGPPLRSEADPVFVVKGVPIPSLAPKWPASSGIKTADLSKVVAVTFEISNPGDENGYDLYIESMMLSIAK